MLLDQSSSFGSKEIAEVEHMLNQIRESIGQMEGSNRLQYDPFKVEEMDKESSSSSSNGEKMSLEVNQQWSQAL
jgi:hypothetical protein